MKQNKKAELSLGVVVTAIILLVVAVAVIAIFVRNFGGFSHSLETCEFKGGRCLDSCPSGDGLNEGCYDKEGAPTGQVCCIGPCAIAGGECKSECGEGERNIPATECSLGLRCCA